LLFILALILSSHYGVCQSYSYNGYASGNINITSVQNITFTANATTTYFNTIADYQSGKISTNYGTIAIKSNVPWHLSVSAQTATFTPTTGGSTNMPASVLSFKLSTGSTYVSLSTSSQTLKTGNRGTTTTSGNTFNIDQKFTPGFGYKGGIYTLAVMYTLAQQ
jgi:hypothetical protein